MVRRQSALVEMPVAFVHDRKRDSVRIVTLWKRNTRPMPEFLEDASVTDDRKAAAVLACIRKLARLNAAGFRHDHLGPKNVLIQEAEIDRVHLVDIDLLKTTRSPKRKPWPSGEIGLFASLTANYLPVRKAFGKTYDELQSHFEDYYQRHYTLFLKKKPKKYTAWISRLFGFTRKK